VSRLRLPPLGLYIHIPWCERKCPYCDFNSHEPEGRLPESGYIDVLLRDLELDLEWVQGREIHSVFIGGGTPSLLSVEAVADLLGGVRERVALKADCEITLEANPGSAETRKFRGFAAAGVNRLSLGIQSFNDERLAALGRIHSAREARQAVEMAREAGIDNLNLDLMHGLPGQGVAAACADLAQAISLEPEHLSWYELTIERNTAFWKQPPVLPPEPEMAAIQSQGEAILADSGYRNYEVSAYARSGYRCHHNLNYWQFGDYLGIGAGAHGKITRAEQGDILRTAKRRQPDAYLAAHPGRYTALRETVTAEERITQYMMNALRLTDGFAPAEFEARTGLPEAAFASALERLQARALLTSGSGRIRTTPLGRRFLDDVIAEFIPAARVEVHG
jgi:oxygen-independent coproporphyrinogen-3 oxidase